MTVLSFLFDRICREKHIKNPTWTHSTYRRNELIFTAENIISVQDAINEALKQHSPPFTADYVDSDVSFLHLSGKVERWMCEEKTATVSHQFWTRSGEAATCELIVGANQRHKHDERRGLFAVTSAHLFLGKEFTKHLVGLTDINAARAALDQQKKSINSMIETNIYRLRAELDREQKYYDLSNPTLI